MTRIAYSVLARSAFLPIQQFLFHLRSWRPSFSSASLRSSGIVSWTIKLLSRSIARTSFTRAAEYLWDALWNRSDLSGSGQAIHGVLHDGVEPVGSYPRFFHRLLQLVLQN